MTTEKRELISQAARAALEVLTRYYEETLDPGPIVLLAGDTSYGKWGIDFLKNLGLVEALVAKWNLTGDSLKAFIYDNTKLIPTTDFRQEGLDSFLVNLTPNTMACIVQEGAEKYLSGAHQLRTRPSPVKPPGPEDANTIVAPVSPSVLEEMLMSAPNGGTFIVNATTYAEIRMFGRDYLEMVTDSSVLQRGILAFFIGKNVTVRIAREVSENEVLLIDTRGTLVAQRHIIRYIK